MLSCVFLFVIIVTIGCKSFCYYSFSKNSSLQFVNLKTPLPIASGESITISVETTDDIYNEPWWPTIVTFEQIIGIQMINSCEDSFHCFQVLINSLGEENCTLSNFASFWYELYKTCVGKISSLTYRVFWNALNKDIK